MYLAKPCLGLGELGQFSFGIPIDFYSLSLEAGATPLNHVALEVEPHKTLDC